MLQTGTPGSQCVCLLAFKERFADDTSTSSNPLAPLTKPVASRGRLTRPESFITASGSQRTTMTREWKRVVIDCGGTVGLTHSVLCISHTGCVSFGLLLKRSPFQTLTEWGFEV